MSEIPPDQDPLSFNPYAPTTYTDTVPVTTDDVEAYRRKYLSHEASCKSIGTLYLLGAILMTPMGLFALIGSLLVGPDSAERGFVFLMGVVYLSLGLTQGWVGLGLRKLLDRGRTGGIVLSAIGLLAIPVGTIISAYFLYLLLSEKGRIVFSPQYRKVITQTPHIRYKTSIVAWIVLLFIVAAIVSLVVLGG